MGWPCGEGADVLDDELGLEGVGVVEVALVAGVEREVGEVAVVEVEWEERGFELGGEFARRGWSCRSRSSRRWRGRRVWWRSASVEASHEGLGRRLSACNEQVEPGVGQ